LSSAVSQYRPILDATRCTGCGLCAAACPCDAVVMQEGIPTFRCGDYCHLYAECPALSGCSWPCEEACPTRALSCPFEIVIEPDDPGSPVPETPPSDIPEP